jgi:acetyl esterase
MVLAPDSAAYLAEVARLNLPARTIDEIRARYRSLCAHFALPRLEVASVVDGSRTRLYANSDRAPVLVWFHGGRMISGDLETHDALCRQLVHHSGWRVLAVDYRLAPEHPYPAVFEDATLAMDAAHLLSPTVAVGGDSAGAIPAIDAARGGAAAMVLVYPMIDATLSSPSHAEFRTGPGPSSEDMRFGYDLWLQPGTDRRDPHISPLFETNLAALPPAFVAVSGVDSLRDEGLRFAQKLPSPTLAFYEGEVHGFLTYGARFRAAGDVIERIAAFLAESVVHGAATKT